MKQLRLNLGHELIVDNFAGGGGASTGIELALGRPVDIAINHDPDAVALHRMNHPQTRHYCESVWDVDPRVVTAGRSVGLAWFSPDCKHFSRAKGGIPVEKKIRSLAWVALRWAATVRPRIIMLENVEEFVTWGPLIVGPCGQMRPDPKQRGREFRCFVNALRRQKYLVEWRKLRACDYSTPTIRKRLFLIASRDGLPIVWPEPTHGDPRAPGFAHSYLKPWRTAAECIDWSIPCPSIFERARPLAEATCRRINKGIMRYVVNADTPFVVPLRTICAQAKGGHHALVVAFLIKNFTGVVGAPLTDPMSTVTAVDHHSLVTAQLASAGRHADDVHAFLVKYYGNDGDVNLRDPLHTVTTRDRFGLVTVRCEQYAIADIGLRMLAPHELFRAQGFPDEYVIDRGDFDGEIRPLTKTAQTRMCGNSVCPPLAATLVQANAPCLAAGRIAA
jgi:DNA (cytosine-5)-methyltransferase 1